MLSETLANFYLQPNSVIVTYVIIAIAVNLVNYFINVAKVEKMRVSSSEQTEKTLYRWQKYVKSGGSRFAMIVLVGLWNEVAFGNIRSAVTEKILVFTKPQVLLIKQNLKWGLLMFLIITLVFLFAQVVVSSKNNLDKAKNKSK